MGNVLARVPKGNGEMVAAAGLTVFAQPDAEHVHSQLDGIACMLGRQFPAGEATLREAEDDLVPLTAFPMTHRKKIWSTNTLERLNNEIKHHTDIVGVFPNPDACSASLGPSWSRPTSNGRSATAANPKAPWPCSTAPARSRRWRSQPCSRHSHPTADRHGDDYLYRSAGRLPAPSRVHGAGADLPSLITDQTGAGPRSSIRAEQP
jgi:hypothetical protein